MLQGAVAPATNHEIMIIKDVNFYSLCEHHLLPFFGRCHVAYIPTTTAIRPSAVARLVDLFSRRLQVQERLTSQIADVVGDALTPIGVAGVMEATHLCMSMRGVEKQNSLPVTSAMLGAFREDARARTQLLERLTLRADRSAVGAPGASNRTCPA